MLYFHSNRYHFFSSLFSQVSISIETWEWSRMWLVVVSFMKCQLGKTQCLFLYLPPSILSPLLSIPSFILILLLFLLKCHLQPLFLIPMNHFQFGKGDISSGTFLVSFHSLSIHILSFIDIDGDGLVRWKDLELLLLVRLFCLSISIQ